MLDTFSLPFVQRRPLGRPPAGGRGRHPRHLDRAARARLLLARGRHRGVPGPGAGRRAGLRGPDRRAGRGGGARRRASGWSPAAGARAYDSATAIVLVGCLAIGVILASDVFESGSNIETLLFGSLLVVDGGDIALAIGVAALALVLNGGARAALARARLRPRARALVRLRRPGARRRAAGRGRAGRGRGAVGGRRAAGHRAAGRARRHHAPVVPPAAALAGRHGRADRARGRRGRVARRSRPTRRPARRSPCWPAACSRSAPSRASLPVRRRRRPQAPCCSRSCRAAAAATGAPDGKVAVVATTTQIADFTRAVGGDRVSVTQLLRPEHRPARLRAAPERRRVDRRRPRSSSANGLGLDRLDRRRGRHARARARPSSTWARTCRSCAQARSGEPGDPHWFQDPRNVEARGRADPRPRSKQADPAGAAELRPRRRRVPAAARHARQGHRAVHGAGAARRPQARHRPRRVRLLRDRYGIRVIGAVIPSQTTQAQPSAGETADLARHDRARARPGDLPRGVAQPEAGRGAGPSRPASPRSTSSTATRSGPRSRRARTYLGMEATNADAMVRGFTGGGKGCPIAGLT